MIDGHIHFHNQPYNLDTIDKMVNQAIKNNIDELYLLDHTHKFIEFKFLYSNMTHQESIDFYKDKIKNAISIKEYINFINKVKSISYPVKLHFGLEICYSKEKEEELKEELKKYNFDFLIGSIHFVNGIVIDLTKDIYNIYDCDKLYHDYFNEVKNSIKSGLFTYIAHPDLIKRFDIYPSFCLDEEFDSLAKTFKEYNQETENNTGLIRYGYSYPGLHPNLIKALLKYNVKFHKSSDAHVYKDIGRVFNQIIENL